jgi:hypothetical protein
MGKNSKISPKKILILILVAYLVLAMATLHRGTHWGDDFAAYLMQAISLVNGDVPTYIEQNTFSMSQSTWDIGPVVYPWGYPFLLAPVYAIFGLNLMAFKSISIILYLLFLICFYCLIEQKLETSDSLFLVAIFAFSPVMLSFPNYLMADIPFLLFSTLALYLIERVVIQEKKIFHPLADMVLLAFSIAYATSIRGNGILLLLPVMYCQIWKVFTDWKIHREISRFKIFHYIFFFLAFLYFYVITAMINPTTKGDYFSQISKTISFFIAKNFNAYSLLLSTFLHTKPFNSLQNQVLFFFLLPFCLVGIWRRAGKEFQWFIYAAATFSLVVLWPYFQGLRFVLPILPIYSYFCLHGLIFLLDEICSIFKAEKCLKPLKLVIYLVCTLALLAGSIARAANNLATSRPTHDGPYAPSSIELFNVITNKTTEDNIIVFFKPRVMHLYTGRNSFATNQCADLEKADYLVMYKHTNMEQITWNDLPACKEKMWLDLVYENSDFEMYLVEK